METIERLLKWFWPTKFYAKSKWRIWYLGQDAIDCLECWIWVFLDCLMLMWKYQFVFHCKRTCPKNVVPIMPIIKCWWVCTVYFHILHGVYEEIHIYENFLTQSPLSLQCLYFTSADVAQLARAPAFQAGCCGFESHRPLHCKIIDHLTVVLFCSS